MEKGHLEQGFTGLATMTTKARTEPNVDRRTRTKIQALYLKNHKKFL